MIDVNSEVNKVDNVQNKLDELKLRIEALNEPEKSVLMDMVKIIQSLVEKLRTCSEIPKDVPLMEFIKKKETRETRRQGCWYSVLSLQV